VCPDGGLILLFVATLPLLAFQFGNQFAQVSMEPLGVG